MYKQFHKATFLAVSLFASNTCFTLDESRLWLPSNYERVYLDLKASALAAEALERCSKVLRGTIDLRQSTDGHPIFRIQCRQPNGRTYNELVDGLTHETLTTVKVIEKALTPEELEARRLEALLKEQKVINDKKARFLLICLSEFKESTQLFIDLVLLNPNAEPEEFELDKAKFYLDFNAKDVNDVDLEYRAICMVQEEEGAELHIRKRR